jgi:hypothetical protein
MNHRLLSVRSLTQSCWRHSGVWAYLQNTEVVGEASRFAPVSGRSKAGRFAYTKSVISNSEETKKCRARHLAIDQAGQ